MVFDGNRLAKEIKEELAASGELVGKRLIIFQTGDKESTYVRLKREMGESLGVKVRVVFSEGAPDLTRLNENVDGVLVQLPIVGVDEKGRDDILRQIPKEKDVDGLNPDSNVFLPAVVVAVEKILVKVGVDKDKMTVAVVGSKGMIGKALVKRFSAKGFDMGDDLARLKDFDVVISATGQPGLVKASMVKEGVVAVDLGYPKADFDDGVKEKASVITPVPGGVGPVTVLSLFENLSKTG